MRVQRQGRARNIGGEFAVQIEGRRFGTGRAARVLQIAERGLLPRIVDADLRIHRADIGRQVQIGFEKVGARSAMLRIEIVKQAAVDRHAADILAVTREQVDLGVTGEADARRPGAGVKAAFVSHGDAALDRRVFAALGEAAEAIVGYQRHAARNGDRIGGRFVLGESGGGKRGSRKGKAQARAGESLHGLIPLTR